MPRDQLRFVERAGQLVAVFPLVVLGGIYALAGRAYFVLGHWPDDHDPPSDLFNLFPGHYGLVSPFDWTVWLAVLPAFGLAPELILGRIRPELEQRVLRLWLIASVVFWFLRVLDPGEVIRWFLD